MLDQAKHCSYFYPAENCLHFLVTVVAAVAKSDIAVIAHMLVPDGCCSWLQSIKLQNSTCG